MNSDTNQCKKNAGIKAVFLVPISPKMKKELNDSGSLNVSEEDFKKAIKIYPPLNPIK